MPGADDGACVAHHPKRLSEGVIVADETVRMNTHVVPGRAWGTPRTALHMRYHQRFPRLVRIPSWECEFIQAVGLPGSSLIVDTTHPLQLTPGERALDLSTSAGEGLVRFFGRYYADGAPGRDEDRDAAQLVAMMSCPAGARVTFSQGPRVSVDELEPYQAYTMVSGSRASYFFTSSSGERCLTVLSPRGRVALIDPGALVRGRRVESLYVAQFDQAPADATALVRVAGHPSGSAPARSPGR